MNIVVQIVNFVLPYLVNFVSKHIEGWLNCFSKYISQKDVVFNLGQYGVISRKSWEVQIVANIIKYSTILNSNIN